jgi:hypothetical protein
MQKTQLLVVTAITLAAFTVGRWSSPAAKVRADSAGSPMIQVQPIRGDSSLTVYYPGINKLFVYQNPFVGSSSWNCSYSVQLSGPGERINRQPCPNAGQQLGE